MEMFRNPYPTEYDVIVAGGGPAGIAAAVSAARTGAKTALIERYGILGGMLTSGHVQPILGFAQGRTMYDEIVEFSELQKFMDVPIMNYSSGMRARLGFSIATIVEPEILILDEVLSVGDAKFKKKSEEKIMSMMKDDVTVLFVSHSSSQVRKICNKAIILEQGRLMAQGTADEMCAIYDRMIAGETFAQVMANPPSQEKKA